MYGHYLINVGRPEESVSAFLRARELDPLSVGLTIHLGQTYLVAGNPDRTVELCREALDIEPSHTMPHLCLGIVHVLRKNYAEAIPVIEKSLEFTDSPWNKAILAMAYGGVGRADEVLEIQAELMHLGSQGQVVSLAMALAHLGLGEKDQALDWVEKAFENDEPVADLTWMPVFDDLRSAPRFQELLARLSLPE